MALADPCSSECAKSELELFTLPSTQTSVEETRIEPFYPLTSLDGNGPIEFRVTTGVDEMIDTNDVWLYTKARILDGDGKPLPKPAAGTTVVPNKSKVFPINYFNASMYRQVEVLLNSTPLPPVSLYQYRGFLETLLSYDPNVKANQLVASLWLDDEGKNIDKTDPTSETEHKGGRARWELSQYSKTFECLGRIHHDLFEQSQLLLNKVTLGVRFHRSDVNFVLMANDATEKYRIDIEKAMLLVTVKKISSHVREAIETRLLDSNAKYNLRHVEMKFFTKGSERADISVPNLCNGILPSHIILGMVETDAFNGGLQKNPFNFKPFSVIEMSLQKNGMHVPFKPLTTNFDDKSEVLLGYFQLMHAIGLWNKNKTNGIHIRNDYCVAKNLYAVNLSQDFTNGGHLNLIQEGNVGLTLRLKQGQDTSITIITYLVYPSTVLEINQQREIFYNE